MIPAGARCAVHAAVAAVDVCQRCGRFLCGDCVELVDEDAYCADCAPRVNVPASKLSKVGLCIAAAGWLGFGLVLLGVRLPVFGLVLLLFPAPAALAALILGMLEWRRIKAGLSAARGKRWVIATFVLALPLLLMMVAMTALGVSLLLHRAGD